MQLPHNSLYDRRINDFYATRDQRAVPALKLVLQTLKIKFSGTVADLCCGEGHILKHFENTNEVYGADLIDRGYAHHYETADLLLRNKFPAGVTLHVSNLPYERNIVNQLTQKLLNLTSEAKGTLCLLFRHQFASGFDLSRQVLFETPNFVGEFKLPFRPVFELPVFIWGKDATPSPQHPYAWYIWNFSKEWNGITRYAPKVPTISKFLQEDIELGQQIDTDGQKLILDHLAGSEKGYIQCFDRLRAGEKVMNTNQKWQFCSDGDDISQTFIKALLDNKGASRNKHFGTLKPMNDGLPLLDTSQTFKWII